MVQDYVASQSDSHQYNSTEREEQVCKPEIKQPFLIFCSFDWDWICVVRKKTSDSDDEDYPLPKASYGTLKDKQLKDLLREYGLPVTGDRTAWEQRHQQCVSRSFVWLL